MITLQIWHHEGDPEPSIYVSAIKGEIWLDIDNDPRRIRELIQCGSGIDIEEETAYEMKIKHSTERDGAGVQVAGFDLISIEKLPDM